MNFAKSLDVLPRSPLHNGVDVGYCDAVAIREVREGIFSCAPRGTTGVRGAHRPHVSLCEFGLMVVSPARKTARPVQSPAPFVGHVAHVVALRAKKKMANARRVITGVENAGTFRDVASGNLQAKPVCPHEFPALRHPEYAVAEGRGGSGPLPTRAEVCANNGASLVDLAPEPLFSAQLPRPTTRAPDAERGIRKRSPAIGARFSLCNDDPVHELTPRGPGPGRVEATRARFTFQAYHARRAA